MTSSGERSTNLAARQLSVHAAIANHRDEGSERLALARLAEPASVASGTAALRPTTTRFSINSSMTNAGTPANAALVNGSATMSSILREDPFEAIPLIDASVQIHLVSHEPGESCSVEACTTNQPVQSPATSNQQP